MRKLSSKLAGQQSGFTLIELVIVIVIIGILAAVAIPNFTDVSSDAKKSAANGIASTFASAAAANAAGCSAPAGTAMKVGCKVSVVGCTIGSMQALGMSPTGLVFGGTGSACTIAKDGGAASDPVVIKCTDGTGAPAACTS